MRLRQQSPPTRRFQACPDLPPLQPLSLDRRPSPLRCATPVFPKAALLLRTWLALHRDGQIVMLPSLVSATFLTETRSNLCPKATFHQASCQQLRAWRTSPVNSRSRHLAGLPARQLHPRRSIAAANSRRRHLACYPLLRHSLPAPLAPNLSRSARLKLWVRVIAPGRPDHRRFPPLSNITL